MGIGLAISRSIVESHGGSIGVHWARGPGTSIRFSIPSPAAERG
jgi:signal transduction histidine kinase